MNRPSSGGAEVTAPPSPEVLKFAERAVSKLGIKDFIEKHLNDILLRLEECEESAVDAPVDADMMFVALSLPVMNGIINIWSNQTKLTDAMGWVGVEWGASSKADPKSILSALILIYLVAAGWRLHRNTVGKQEVWNRILRRVKRLAEEMES